ncbi:mycothione reductase [Streptomyces sp. SB3404]|uniref:Mycothione reductase n=2 Tax=Streptomyces boncukensis TaxID=2711219 RepID=A0A6G4X5L0_9ACTN|nr:mycothione reductase [Streptomyces boncukensis]
MAAARHYDLVIVGSGSGNSLVDERFDEWNVAIVERGVGSTGAYGGTCLNVGCIPTKMLAHTADTARAPGHGERLGLDLELRGAPWPAIRDRIFGRIDPIAAAGERYRAQENPNVTLYRGTARFTGERELAVETAEGTAALTADRVVVAAGSRPEAPQVPGLDGVGYHTSDSVMRLAEVPRRLIVLGTGFVGTELAHVFASLGSQVTVIGRSGLLLRHQDGEIARHFTELARQQWDVRLDRTVKEAGRRDGVVRLELDGPHGAETVEAEELLVATGRRPNADLVGAAAGGLALTDDGRIAVDATQAASVAGVWALGDVSSPYQLKHVANHEARVVQHNLLHPERPVRTDHRFVPHAVFSSPQVAAVGLTEEEARERGLDYTAAVHRYADIAYGWAMEDTTGFAKVLADRGTGRLLGAHILGPEAPTLIQPLIQALHFGLDPRAMARGQYWIHPAMPEVVENALLKLDLP